MKKSQTRVALNIRKLLAEKGKSAEKLAYEIAMSKAYLYNFLNGQKGILLENLDRIADGLDVDIEKLFKK
jgi:transcriptional regulator with XRE-family HTH domain